MSAYSLFQLAPGVTLQDRYEIQDTNRAGSMSAAFRAKDNSDGSECEIQAFPAGLFENVEQAEDFAASMRGWKGVSSGAVLCIRSVEVLEDGSILVVTDLPTGDSLRDLLNTKGAFSPAEVQSIGTTILGGLSAVHAAGHIHGDIKPNAIHLTGVGPVLVDGGITMGLWSAKHLGDKTALIGTPFYAPVEQFGGEAPDISSDIYNVATVLYELTTGVVPWPGQSFLEIFQAKLAPEPARMRDRAPECEVPAALEEVIKGGLITDRRERYSDAGTFRDLLAAASLD